MGYWVCYESDNYRDGWKRKYIYPAYSMEHARLLANALSARFSEKEEDYRQFCPHYEENFAVEAAANERVAVCEKCLDPETGDVHCGWPTRYSIDYEVVVWYSTLKRIDQLWADAAQQQANEVNQTETQVLPESALPEHAPAGQPEALDSQPQSPMTGAADGGTNEATEPDGPTSPRHLKYRGKKVALEPIPYSVLVVLWPDKAIREDTLKIRCWPSTKSPSEDAVKSAVKKVNETLLEVGYPRSVRRENGYVSLSGE